MVRFVVSPVVSGIEQGSTAEDEGMRRTFFRIVRSDPPTEEDFLSPQALAVPLWDPDPEKLRMAEGVSVFNTEIQARNKARAYPRKGRFLALLLIEEDGPITFERTGRDRGHHTLWGDPQEMLRRVERVIEV